MWQLEWAARPRVAVAPDAPAPSAPRSPTAVGGLMWEEHCHECSEPDCYTTCPLFERREDGRCARLQYGIHPNQAFAGLYPFGADVRFRRWGKLESVIPVRRLSTGAARALAPLDRAVTAGTKRIDGVRHWPARHQVTAAYRAGRIGALRHAPTADFDEFLVEAWSPETTSFRLAVEAKCGGAPYFRESVTIEPGWNRFTLPAAAVLAGATDPTARLLVYPENDATVRVVFTWLDLVSYAAAGDDTAPAEPVAPAARADARPASERVPAATVKCVVWDLDNTLWQGILADVGPDDLEPAPGVRELITALDERGILQSVASKNDHEAAAAVLERLGLTDMFLYPAINWGPKSESIRSIAAALNIGVDTFAFVDDSPHERAQVASELPEVRVFTEADIATLLDHEAFDVHPSAEGRARRLSYLAEAKRQQVFAASSTQGIDEFLRSCAIEVEVSTPTGDALVRCHELLLRSNQLNLSTRRYTREEIDELVADPARAPLAVRVRDRFGDYGLVGFLSTGTDAEGDLTVDDLVFSCRVAKKYVENAVLEAVRALVADAVPGITLRFVPTARNGALLEVLGTLGLDEQPGDGSTTFRLPADRVVASADIVASTVVQPAAAERLRAVVPAPVSPTRA